MVPWVMERITTLKVSSRFMPTFLELKYDIDESTCDLVRLWLYTEKKRVFGS